MILDLLERNDEFNSLHDEARRKILRVFIPSPRGLASRSDVIALPLQESTYGDSDEAGLGNSKRMVLCCACLEMRQEVEMLETESESEDNCDRMQP